MSQEFGARIRIRPYVRVVSPFFPSFFFSSLSYSAVWVYNKTIGEKQMNIKTITLMDFDWDDFIEAMEVNIVRLTRRITTSNDCIFKLHFRPFI